uniref:Small ribosomal subunit protein bS18c n=1 Tax=Platysiphonia delicata TaxID=2006979 RepID=A0A1Z1M0J8_9FLOR|nr:ribosomal protein S18 [Platysiphonia delicata]ARW59589.1 ribosomal protein S18 [Platysiphonia delicata]
MKILKKSNNEKKVMNLLKKQVKDNDILDYKDIDLLKKYINDQGKILSRRSTGVKSKQQKIISKYIKRARTIGLLPFLKKD